MSSFTFSLSEAQYLKMPLFFLLAHNVFLTYKGGATAEHLSSAESGYAKEC
jgi:hypothetical protein